MRLRPMEKTEADVARLGALFEANGNPKEAAMLRWRYLENPVDSVWVDFAEADGGRVAAAYCVSPYRFRLGAATALGVQSLDTLVDSAYRGHGLFTRLAEQTYARCQQDGVALVYGFPNHASAPGFFGRLRWTRLDPVPFLVRPLRLGYLLRKLGVAKAGGRWADWLRAPVGQSRLPPELEIRAQLAFDERFTELWRRFAEDRVVGVERDAGFLSWRFRAPFRGGYAVYGLMRRGELEGYVVFRLADKHGGRIGYVMELIHVGPPAHGVALLRYALSELVAGGAEVVLAWSLPHAANHGCYRRCGFLPLPQALRPIELHFGARTFADVSALAVGNRANWYLSYVDSDTV